MVTENESPTGGNPGAEVTERPKIITCPCCESVIFRNGELKKKGARMIELEKAESASEKLTEEVSALKSARETSREQAPAVQETPAPTTVATSRKKRGFLLYEEDANAN